MFNFAKLRLFPEFPNDLGQNIKELPIYSLLVCLNINFLRKNLFKMIRFSEIITTFAYELERHEKTCWMKTQFNIERFDIISH